MSRNRSSTILLSLVLLQFLGGSDSATFTIVNKCSLTVWPGLSSEAGSPGLPSTGFVLHPGDSNSLFVLPSWSGRIWGRTLCSQDPKGNFSCATGDCGSSTLECSGRAAAGPVTLAEFTLKGTGGIDFYDVSLVDGYNLPMTIVPQGGTEARNCSATGCVKDLIGPCPSQLKLLSFGNGVGCWSACEAFRNSQYCCTGAYSTPETCKPTLYSEFFKTACPLAYSYPLDDANSTFTCASADYVITFCSTGSTSVKPIDGNGTEPVSGVDVSAANVDYSARIFDMMIVILAASLWLWQIVHY